MIYRHIYWGLLTVGPDEHNLLTDAVKKKNYLVKIVTPFAYKTKEEAAEDGFEYYFSVVDDHPCMLGLHHGLDDLIDAGVKKTRSAAENLPGRLGKRSSP